MQKAFQYFNSFMASEPNDLDVLLLDEAHRIRETSANRWTKAEFRTGRRQVDELLSAARVPVFLLDQFQVVRPGEQGTIDGIEADARAAGLDVLRVDLDAQFRCGGSLAYVEWVQRLLGLRPGGPAPWTGDDFDVQVMDSVEELDVWVGGKANAGFGARIAAGYCWPWSDLARTERSCRTSRSARGRNHGTSKANARWVALRRQRCGRPIPPASGRWGVSTRRRVSNTTMPA